MFYQRDMKKTKNNKAYERFGNRVDSLQTKMRSCLQ